MTIEDDFNRFMEFLKQATSNMTDEHYFSLPVYELPYNVFRERTYCYELYHQLRNVFTDDFPYKLDGEVDKIKHPRIESLMGPVKPDFIVHQPDAMDKNLVVIEVKSINGINTNFSDYMGDILTLRDFLEGANYYYAIMYVYDDGHFELSPRTRDVFNDILREYDGRKKFIWHHGPKTQLQILD